MASTHTLEELLAPQKAPQLTRSQCRAAAWTLLAAGMLTAAAACSLAWQLLAEPAVPSDSQAWGYLSPGLYYSLVVPCSVPVALVLITSNWLSLKLFKFSAC